MTGAEIVIPKLMQEFEVIIVTARNETEVGYAKEKLSILGLSTIEIFYNRNDKIGTLLEQKVDFIIDDDEDLCKEASKKGIHAIYFKNAAADFLEMEYLKTVNNWGEVYKYFMLKEKDGDFS